MRYKLTLAYDGTHFHGWQQQSPPETAELRTVQSVLREAIQHVVRQPVLVTGASRTDAGVHALGQVVSFDAQDLTIPIDRLALAINARLPEDVEVRSAEIVADDFEVISGAVEKQYRYRLWNSTHRPLTQRHVVHHFWEPLDPAKMSDAARRLVGEHDFAAFANVAHGRQSTVRTVTGCEVEQHPLHIAPALAGVPVESGREIHIVVRGGGFLYNMVRIMAGTLVEVGRGHRPPEYVDELLRGCDRQQAGPTLPPQGLTLEWIKYG